MITQEEKDVIGIYFGELKKVPLLKPKEVVLLIKRIKRGMHAKKVLLNEVTKKQSPLDSNHDAQLAKMIKLVRTIKSGQEGMKTLVKSNIGLVASIAKKYARYTTALTLLDLIQEGALGLFTAAQKFDCSRACQFSTYAYQWIRQRIGRALEDQAKTIRIPVHLSRQLSKYQQAEGTLFTRLERRPTTEEIAKHLNVDIEKVRDTQRIAASVFSLENLIATNSEKSFSCLIEEEKEPESPLTIDQSQKEKVITQALAKLDTKEQMIISKRFGLNGQAAQTLQAISVQLKLTKERIRQIQNRALEKLRYNQEISKLQ